MLAILTLGKIYNFQESCRVSLRLWDLSREVPTGFKQTGLKQRMISLLYFQTVNLDNRKMT